MPSLQKKHIQEVSPVECPICTSTVTDVEYAYSYSDKEGWLYRCQSCRFLFLRPLLLEQLDERRMDGIQNAEMHDSSLLKTIYAELFVKREIRRIRKILGDRSFRLLDIVCGTGWMTKLYSEHGMQVVGLEPSAARAKVATENYNLNVLARREN